MYIKNKPNIIKTIKTITEEKTNDDFILDESDCKNINEDIISEEGKEKQSRSVGNEEVLQVLPQTHDPQRDQVIKETGDLNGR